MSESTTLNNVFIAPEPLTPRVDKLHAPPGVRMDELLAEACNRNILSLDDLDRIIIFVNGEELAEEVAMDYVTKLGDVVNVTMTPLGGGGRGGGNKVLQAVLTIAVIAVSFWIGGPAGPLAALKGVTGTLVRAAAAAAVQVGGSLAISTLFKPDEDQLANANSAHALQDQSNQYRPRAPMPLVLGKRRVAFDLAARPYTQNVGNDMYLHVIFGIHYGPCTLTDIKIGETKLTDYPAADIATEAFLTPGPRISALYPGRVVQENLGDQLTIGGAAEVHTTAQDAERIEIDLTWPGGLRYNKDNGKILPQETQLLVEYAVAGSGNWLAAPVGTYTNRHGQVVPPGNIYVQARTQDAVRHTAGWVVTKGQYDVRVRAWDPDNDDPDTVVQDVYWTALRTIENIPPILDDNLSCLVVRIKASDDLNGSLPVVSGIVEPIVPVWNGSDWNTTAASSNAAELARWLVTGPAAASPMAALDIHSSILDAQALIEQHDWKGSLLVTTEMSLEDLLNALGRMGRFSTYWNGSQICFVTDWQKPAARQLFSDLNAQGYRYKRVFPGEIHAVLVEYVNADKDWITDELWVYMDGYDQTNATLFETLRLDYSCTRSKAYRDGRVYLAKRVLQVELHEWTAGADAIVSTYGDRVRVRHNSTLFGVGDGYVQFRRFQGGLISGVRLDVEIPFEVGKSYACDIRTNGFVNTGVTIINPGKPSRDIVFGAPLAVADAPVKGDFIVFGETGQVTEDLEIIDFEPQADGTVSVRAQLYAADGIMAAETGPIPPLQGDLSPSDREESPIPRIIRAEGDPNGVRVIFDIPPVKSGLVIGFASRWRRSADTDDPAGEWSVLPNLPPTARQVNTPPIPEAAVPPEESDTDGQYRVDVEIRTIMQGDRYSRPGLAYGILVSKDVPEPKNFYAVGVKRDAPDGSAYPAIECGCDPIIGGEVQDLIVELKEGAGPWAHAATFAASNPFGDLTGIKSSSIYSVRARWRTADNWRSDWVTITNIAVGEGWLIAYEAIRIGQRLAADAIAQLDQQGADVLALQAAVNQLIAEGATLGSEEQQALEDAAEAALAAYVALADWRERFDQLTHYADGETVANVLVSEREERITADSAFQYNFDLMGSVAPNGQAWIFNENTTMVDPTMSLAEWRQSIGVQFSQAEQDFQAFVQQEATARSDADMTFAENFSLLGVQTPDGQGWALDTLKVFITPTETLSQRFTSLTAALGDNSAAISSEATARATADGVFTTNFTLMGGRSLNGQSWILDSDKVKLSETESLGSRLSSINTRFGDNEALFTQEVQTRATADSVFAQNFTLLGGRTQDGTGWVLDTSKVLVGTSESMAQRLTSIQSSLGANSAAINNEATTRANADSAHAQQIQSVTATANNAQSSASQALSASTQFGAKYGLRLNQNGYVTGFVANNDGQQGNFVFLTDNFVISTPNGLVQPFVITNGLVYMPNVYITNLAAHSITADHIYSNSIQHTQRGGGSTFSNIPGFVGGFGCNVVGPWVDVDVFVNVNGSGGSIGHYFDLYQDGAHVARFGNYSFGGWPYNQNVYFHRAFFLSGGWHGWDIYSAQQSGGGSYHVDYYIITVRDNKTQT